MTTSFTRTCDRKEELAQLYGDAASLGIDGSADEGTTVRIEIPVRRLSDAEPRAEAKAEATVG